MNKFDGLFMCCFATPINSVVRLLMRSAIQSWCFFLSNHPLPTLRVDFQRSQFRRVHNLGVEIRQRVIQSYSLMFGKYYCNVCCLRVFSGFIFYHLLSFHYHRYHYAILYRNWKIASRSLSLLNRWFKYILLFLWNWHFCCHHLCTIGLRCLWVIAS